MTFIRYFSVLFAVMAVASAQAQSIRVTDKEGRGIPDATVLDTKGNLIGRTSQVGILGDVRGVGEVLVTHMAYKPQKVVVSSLKDKNVIMESAGYSLPELEGNTKSHYYAEIFYRAYAFVNGALKFHTAGIMPIDYNLRMVNMGDYKNSSGAFYIGSAEKKKYQEFFKFQFSPAALFLPKILEGKKAQEALSIKIKDVDDKEKDIYVYESRIGKITRSYGQTCTSLDMMKILNNMAAKMGQDYMYLFVFPDFNFNMQYTAVSDCKDGDRGTVDDLKMFSTQYSWTEKGEHDVFIIESYVVERQIFKSKEFKTKKKLIAERYKAPMSLGELESYAAEHRIPTLAPTLRDVIEGKTPENTTSVGNRAISVRRNSTSAVIPNYKEGEVALTVENFPDVCFREWLSKQDYGIDGVLTEAEIERVKHIDVAGKHIKNLKGIEYFKNLKYLVCSDNQLSALNVSNNTHLEILQCYGNQLSALDVSKNVALEEIRCHSNQLTSLDVSNNTALKKLWCHSNQMTTLNVPKNSALTELYCYSNQLTTLDVSNNPDLTGLFCENNKLITLDVSNNPALIRLHCHQNQIKDEAMDALIESLPTVENRSMSVIYQSSAEQNLMTAAQVAAAKSKGWLPHYYNGSKWVELEK